MEFKLDDDLRQRKLRAFSIALKRHQPEEWENIADLPLILYLDTLARAAIEAEWFIELPTIDGSVVEVDDMKYPDLQSVALKIAELYGSVTVLEKN